MSLSYNLFTSSEAHHRFKEALISYRELLAFWELSLHLSNAGDSGVAKHHLHSWEDNTCST